MRSHEHLAQIARLVRRYILIASTNAGSGHPTSGLSAADLMVGLLFGGVFRYDIDHPDHPNNDRLIFSKGHASPLLYALWAAAGKLSREDILAYRRFDSPLEGHPTPAFPYVDVATGSLGQGLSIGVGMAMNSKFLDKLSHRTYVLLGDSEMSEGSQWEAIQAAAHYGLDNLTGILDVNRLGQRGETMYGHDIDAYVTRVSAFGWKTVSIDGHSFRDILDAFETAAAGSGSPTMIIAKTFKGKGVSFLEDQNRWHGKAVEKEDLESALEEVGEVDESIRGDIPKPEDLKPKPPAPGKVNDVEGLPYESGESVPTRKAYGNALKRIYPRFPQIVGLDGEVSNSTKSETFKEAFPDRFFEMYIMEQNMAGVALGLADRGKIPFVSTFAAFLTRAFDQIRMSRYSDQNIKFVGSHAGVSIGQDGPSQMGLEDIAMFRTILDGVVLYPADAVSTEKLVEEAAKHTGIVYIRTTRGGTSVIYDSAESFPIGGCKVVRSSDSDKATVVAAGITVYEALKAYDTLKSEGILIRVIDCYSIKPIDQKVLGKAAEETRAMVSVEDHYAEGGLGEAVKSALASDHPVPVHSLAVRKKPKSGKPEELLDYEEISHTAIETKVREIIA
ncbi:MAG: transketolase [Desulfobacterales bacterium]